jgi:triacylglycerol lipase
MSARGSRGLVDPQLVPLLDMMPPFQLSAETLPAVRAASKRQPVAQASVELVEMAVHHVPGPPEAPDVEVLVYRPKCAEGDLPCIFHIHGGGYLGGAAADLEGLHRPMAAELGCCIVATDYRLAPETRHPGPVEDAYVALCWLHENAATMGILSDRIGIMGESAGGGLAAAVALMARDQGTCPLAFQHLIYPMLDDRTCVAAEPHPYAGEFLWTAHNNAFAWGALLGVEPGSEEVSPYAAPARAETLAGLPPAYIAAGALDLFLEEDIEYARRLTRDGVPVELHVYPGAFHGFDMAPGAAVAAQARRDSLEALARALFPR